MIDKKHQLFKDIQKGRKEAKRLKNKILQERNNNRNSSNSQKPRKTGTGNVELINKKTVSKKENKGKAKGQDPKAENKKKLCKLSSLNGNPIEMNSDKAPSVKSRSKVRNDVAEKLLNSKPDNQIIFKQNAPASKEKIKDAPSKSESEMLKQRKWKLMIDNIKIENLTTENINCFLGNFILYLWKLTKVIKIEKLKSNSSVILVPRSVESIPEELQKETTSEFKSQKKMTLACEVSELKAGLQKNSVDSIGMIFKKDFWLSYSDLFTTIIVFQVWTNSPWSVNNLLGQTRENLYSLATGNVKREYSLYCNTSSGKKQTAKVNMRILLQEHWYYIMSFHDFGVTNVVNNKGNLIDCQLKLKLRKGTLGHRELSSEVVRKKKNPKWNAIQGTINFKGTLEALEEQDLVLQVLDYGNFRDDVLTSEQISLKGILDSQTLQIPLKFFVKEKLR
jgi:hypothetical protein